MSTHDLENPAKGVYRGVPMARHLPCEESTEPLAEFIAQHCGRSESIDCYKVEWAILRFLVDNKMRIVGE